MSTGLLDNFKVGEEIIEAVNSFVFLGAKVEKDGGCAAEIGRRIVLGKTAMSGLTKIMRDKDVSKTTKIRMISSSVFPVVLYGCECWTVRKAEKKKINSFELRCWRRLLRIPWTLMDCQENKPVSA